MSVAHALIGLQSLKLAHFLLVPTFTIPLHSVACLEKSRGNSFKCNSANFSAKDHSQVESLERGYCAKNSAYVNKAG